MRSRRAFILQCAGAVGLIGGMRPAFSADKRDASILMTKNLSCGRIGVRANQVEAAALAHEHGFHSIDPSPGYLAKLNDEELAGFLDDMRTKNLEWASAGMPVQFRNGEREFLGGMKTLPDFAKTLKRVGANRSGTWLMFGSNDLTYRQYGSRMAGRLRAIAEVLGERDIRFGLEYVGTLSAWTTVRYPWVHTMAEARELISDIGLDNVGLVLDSWHWYQAGDSVADILALDNSDIVAVDLNDAPRGLGKREMQDNAREIPCATGVIDTAGFMRALQQAGYDGPVRAEPFNAALAALPAKEAVGTIARSFERAWSYLE